MLLAEYPWLLSQGMKASVRKNIVGGREGACPVSTSHSEFAQILRSLDRSQIH